MKSHQQEAENAGEQQARHSVGRARVAYLVVGGADDDADAGEHGRAPGVAPVDDVVELDNGHHPLERLPEDAFPVGVAAPGRGQLEVLADEERLRPAGHRRRHWPQVDAPAAAAGAGAQPDRRREQHQQQPRCRRHPTQDRRLAERWPGGIVTTVQCPSLRCRTYSSDDI